MPDVNWLAVLGAAVPSFFVGGLWYSKAMFCNAWIREAKIDTEAVKGRHPGKVFAVSLALAVLATYVLATFLGPKPGLLDAVRSGAILGAGLVGASFGINYAFAGRSVRLWAIDAGYHTVQYALAGLILSLLS